MAPAAILATFKNVAHQHQHTPIILQLVLASAAPVKSHSGVSIKPLCHESHSCTQVLLVISRPHLTTFITWTQPAPLHAFNVCHDARVEILVIHTRAVQNDLRSPRSTYEFAPVLFLSVQLDPHKLHSPTPHSSVFLSLVKVPFV